LANSASPSSLSLHCIVFMSYTFFQFVVVFVVNCLRRCGLRDRLLHWCFRLAFSFVQCHCHPVDRVTCDWACMVGNEKDVHMPVICTSTLFLWCLIVCVASPPWLASPPYNRMFMCTTSHIHKHIMNVSR
jgi:hypothetical protein